MMYTIQDDVLLRLQKSGGITSDKGDAMMAAFQELALQVSQAIIPQAALSHAAAEVLHADVRFALMHSRFTTLANCWG